MSPTADVLRSEWIKATTVRLHGVLLGVTSATAGLTSWAMATFGPDDLTGLEVANLPVVSTAVLAAVAGVLLFTGEAQHGTLAAVLAARPARWPIVAGKGVAAAVLGLVIGATGLVAGLAGALVGGIEVGGASAIPSIALWALLYSCGSAVLGLGVGMAMRHSAGAVSGLLVWWLVVEGVVVSFAPGEVVRFVPFDTGWRSLGIESDLDRAEVLAAGLSGPVHASIFWGYVLAALAVGAVLVQRRDAG